MGTSKQSGGSPSGLQRLAVLLRYVPGGALFFAVIPLMILGYFGWYYWGADHLDQALYALRLENVLTTPQPTWIRQSTVRKEVFESGGLSQLSLLDPQASATIARAFESHNWVQHTTRVTKLANGKVNVDVVYRRPAAMVFYKANDSAATPGQVRKGFYPIDDEGVILPIGDFDDSQVWEYFQVYAEGAMPAGDVGMGFGDVRVIQALDLCRVLDAHRVELRLQRIYVMRDHQQAGPSPWVMWLMTSENRQVNWGHAPGKEAPGEPLAVDKLARLIAWHANPSAPTQLDLSVHAGRAAQFDTSSAELNVNFGN